MLFNQGLNERPEGDNHCQKHSKRHNNEDGGQSIEKFVQHPDNMPLGQLVLKCHQLKKKEPLS
jgi:hypothetical protein